MLKACKNKNVLVVTGKLSGILFC